MSRYIDADALIESIKNTADLGGWIGAAVYHIKQVAIKYIDDAPSIDIVRCKCDFGKCHEQGDTLYESSDWDGGIGFDYIRDIKYCPLCGGLLDGEEQTEREGE